MGISQVRSPWSSERGVDPRPREGISPGARSSPSRAPDYVPPPRVRPDDKPVPVQGSTGAAELERAMDRGCEATALRLPSDRAMQTEYLLTEADVGFTFPEQDGFCLSLIRSRGPHPKIHEMNFEQRSFRLRELKAPRDLFSIPADCSKTPLVIGGALFFVINSAIRYFGALTLAAVPPGSEWELTLSDVYVEPRPSLHPSRTSTGYAPNAKWGNVAGYRRPQRQLALAAPPLQLTGPVVGQIEREV